MKFLLDDLVCSECKNTFPSASSLLKHFATHAIQTSSSSCMMDNKVRNCDNMHNIPLNRKMIPDLHPIVKNVNKESHSGVINPLIFCEATLNEDDDFKKSKRNHSSKVRTKKYSCTYCKKHFGWSTDLKRHILIHTGERPFKCNLCPLSFTRNFLLQRHISKSHTKNCKKANIPDLKPIYLVPNSKIKKLSQGVPKRISVEVDSFLNKNFFEIIRNPIYSN